MSDEKVHAPGGERSSGTAVEIFLTGIERTSRSQRVYTQGSGSQKTLEQIYRNLENAYQNLFVQQSEILDVEVRASQMFCERRVVYDNPDSRHSLAKLLFSNGIRVLSIKPGADRREILKLVEVFAIDFHQPEHIDSDLYSALKELALEHFEVVSEDLIHEALTKRPELKQKLADFQNWAQSKTQEKSSLETRRLRPEDLKTLEDFQIRSSAFARPDDEVTAIVRKLTHADKTQDREKATLERLALMGFHFLLQDHDASQTQVGRDLVTQVALLSLRQNSLSLFGGLLKKVQELHKERVQKRGECQKILDQIFHVDQKGIFAELLASPAHQMTVTQHLLESPPCAVKLMVLLLGEDPALVKSFGPLILKSLHEHLSWLLEEVRKDSSNPAWEVLVNLLASRPNPTFSRFLTKLLESAQSTVRVKLLRQCAQLSTPETLQVFRKMIESSHREERLEAYEQLAAAKNKASLSLLKQQLESLTEVDEEERSVLYAALFRMGEDLAYPLFESKWMEPGQGFFKSREIHQRRLALTKAALKAGQSSYFEKILQTTPLQSLSEEIRTLISHAMGNKGVQS